MRPDEIGRSARRLAAKMVADQAATIMPTIVGIQNTGQPSEDVRRTLEGDDLVVVCVARKHAARQLLTWLESNKSSDHLIEIVREEDKGPKT